LTAKKNPGQGPDRRVFLHHAAAASASLLAQVPAVHAGGSGEIKVGLIGCGGRGTGAAEQACKAGDEVRLTALADLFPDRLREKKAYLKDVLGDKFQVKDEHCFTGFDAYKHLIDSGVDVVLLATPPHFRPRHLAYAVEKGKHAFVEKPVAVDSPGVRSVLETCEKARQKKLSIVSGLCWRYDDGMRETMARVHEGAIGDIVALQCTYNVGGLWYRSLKEKEAQGWGDMEWQIRNWLYFTWLSGDHNVEQHIHSLDKMAWAMKDEYPVRAYGVGGRQARTAPDFGHIYDHHAVVYEYANGVRCFSMCRQQPGTAADVSDHIFGTLGMCNAMAYRITGKNPWEFPRSRRRRGDMYQNEQDALFGAIRAGNPINDGDYMCKSTLMAIMGRMATYTGQVITWDMAMHSQEDLTPPVYDLKASMPIPPVAVPGVTKYR
jgi:predicted dehydrogenase